MTRIAIVLLVLVSAAACASRPHEINHIRLAVGGQNQMVYLPATLAQELGYYRDEGLDVELQDHQGGSKALQALIGGSADVVCGFYDHTIQMAAEGRQLLAFVSMLRYPGLVLVTSPRSAASVTKIEDLKGRIAGVTTAGSSSQMLLTYLLQRHGVAPDALSITAIGSASTAIAALEHGKVDAGMLADPAFTILTRRTPGTRVLADLRTESGVMEAFGTATYPASVLYAHAEWVAANREQTRHLARAIVRTLGWMHEHSPQEISARTPKAFRGADDALYADAVKSSMPMFSTDGVMQAAGAEAVHTLLAQSMANVRTAHIDVSRTYTNEYLDGR